MGLGPSLSIRQSQQLVLTPQLRQAIQLLQLSNLELDAFLAEEISKNPLLESAPEEGGDQAPNDSVEESDSEEAPEDPGADNIILGQADDDRPLDRDWQSGAVEPDGFADGGGPGGTDEGFGFARGKYWGSRARNLSCLHRRRAPRRLGC